MDAKILHGFQNGLDSSLLIFLPLKASFLVQGELAADCSAQDGYPGTILPHVFSIILFPGPPGCWHWPLTLLSVPVSDENFPDHV